MQEYRGLLRVVLRGTVANLKLLLFTIIAGLAAGEVYAIDPRDLYRNRNIAFTAPSIFVNNVARVVFALAVAIALYYLVRRLGLRGLLGSLAVWFFPATLIAVNGFLVGMVVMSPKAWALVLGTCQETAKWGPLAVASALIPHGVLELTGVAVLLSPTAPSVREGLEMYGERLIAVATIIGVALLVFAALVETHVSPMVKDYVRVLLCQR